jgi:hypothetical protein
MGAVETKYRKTIEEKSPWVGFCVVVTIDENETELQMPNGEKHKFKFTKNGLQILEGEHKGHYSVQKLDLIPLT